MPKFWAINLPRPVSASPAKSTSSTTSPHRSTQRVSSAMNKRPAEALDSTTELATADSSLNRSGSSKRLKSTPRIHKTSAEYPAPNSKEFQNVYPSNNLPCAAELDVGQEPSSSPESSRDSADLPGIETVFANQNLSFYIKRILLNREKKILPSIEQPNSGPLRKRHTEDRNPKPSKSIVPGSVSNTSQEAEPISQQTASSKTSTISFSVMLEPEHISHPSSSVCSNPIRNSTTSTQSKRPNVPAASTVGSSISPVEVKSEPQRTMTDHTISRNRDILGQNTTPRIFTPKTRRRRIAEDGMVEQPQEEYGLEIVESARQQLKHIEKSLLSHLNMFQKKEEREHEMEQSKRLANNEMAKKERHKLSKRERMDEAESQRELGKATFDVNDIATSDLRTAKMDVSGVKKLQSRSQPQLEHLQSSSETPHTTSAPPKSGQPPAEARNITRLPIEGKLGAHVATGTVGSAKACGRDTHETAKIPKLQNRLGEAKAPERGESSKTNVGSNTPSPAQKVSHPILQRSSAMSSTRESSHVQQRCGNVGSRREATATEGLRNTTSRPWGYPDFRRELVMNNHRLQCKCFYLHPYFRQAWRFEPKFATFPGCRDEFLVQIEQVANYKGHSEEVISAYQTILKTKARPYSVSMHITSGKVHVANRCTQRRRRNKSKNHRVTADQDVEAALEFADGFLSSHSQPASGQITVAPPHTINSSQHAATAAPSALSRPELREQSSIPPWEFYGHENSRPPPRGNQLELTPPPSSPLKVGEATECTDLKHAGALSDSEDGTSSDSENGDEANNRPNASPSNPVETLPLQELSVNERIRRHQSLPARMGKEVQDMANEQEAETLGNRKGLESLVDEIVRKRLADRAVPSVRTRTPEPPPRKKKHRSVAERKVYEPSLMRDVPVEQRKSDADLLEIARRITPYDRHRGAPYAFSYAGKLYAEYKHLRVAVGANNQPALTAQELSRL